MGVSTTHITNGDDYYKFETDSLDNTPVGDECCDPTSVNVDLDAGGTSSTFSDVSHAIDSKVSVNTPKEYRIHLSKCNESIFNDQSYCVTSDTLNSLSSVGETAYHDDDLFIRRLPKHVKFIFPSTEWTRLKKTQKGRCFGRGEWQKSVLNIVKKSNPFCSFKFNFHRVSTATIRKRNDPVFWLTARCQFTDCICSFKFIVRKSMAGIISYYGDVRHAQDDIRARPIRLSERRDFHKQFSLGSLKPMKLQIHNLAGMRGDIYASGNRDSTGKTKHVYQKISSESTAVHRMDPNELISLAVLRDTQKKRN
ncbi:hypothetical protein HOLleu_19067 [Holothuria leucospilota]|uniref:Uncharacterized protein n=1 Tax=Holothuria leucospilota TaxID=206669 RepID=A0A9Q1C4S6_HOLLE|nr:hypothetical protein HOLleu_19067 [Holothuria leucospilota]